MFNKPAQAGLVDNEFNNSSVNQYILIDCQNLDCQVFFEDALKEDSKEETSETEDSSGTEINAIEDNEEFFESEGSGSDDDQNSVDQDLDQESTDTNDNDSNPQTSETEETDQETDQSSEAEEGFNSEEETNSEPAEEGSEEAENQETVEYFPNDIIISEVMAAPLPGNSEWIELFNPGIEEIDLTGWRLTEGSGQETVLSGVIESDGYRVFDKSSLNNTGDIITLTDPSGQEIDQIVYGDWPGSEVETTEKDHSLILYEEQYLETELATPGQENVYQTTEEEAEQTSDNNLADQVVDEQQTEHDSDLSTEEDELANEEDSQNQESDSSNSVEEQTVDREVNETNQETDDSQVDESNQESADQQISAYQYSESIRVNEILANPEGSDDFEWLELYNYGQEDLNLLGWSLQDNGGSSAYVFGQEQEEVIKAGEYLMVKKEKTKITLNNSSDSVILKDPNQVEIDHIDYSQVKEGQSYCYFTDGWQNTDQLSPGAENIKPALQVADYSGSSSGSSTTATAYYPEYSIPEVKKLKKGDLVKIQGQVAVLPDVFGKNYFYIMDKEANGIQIYFSKADWPEFSMGQNLIIKGKMSESYNEKRILVSQKSDIQVLESQDLPVPKSITANDFQEKNEAALVNITGRLLEKDSSHLFLGDSQGEFEVYLKQKTGLSAKLYSENDDLKVTGILSQYKDKYRLLPRRTQDIENLSWQSEEQMGVIQENDVDLAGSSQDSSKKGLILGLVAVGLILLNAVIWLRKKLDFSKLKQKTFALLAKKQS